MATAEPVIETYRSCKQSERYDALLVVEVVRRSFVYDRVALLERASGDCSLTYACFVCETRSYSRFTIPTATCCCVF